MLYLSCVNVNLIHHFIAIMWYCFHISPLLPFILSSYFSFNYVNFQLITISSFPLLTIHSIMSIFMLNFSHLLLQLLAFIPCIHYRYYYLAYTSVIDNIQWSIFASSIIYTRLLIDIIIILIVQFYCFIIVVIQVVAFYFIFIVIIW